MLEIVRATDRDVVALSGDVPLGDQLRDVLDDWRPLLLLYRPTDADQAQPVSLHLVGRARAKERLVITSPVIAMDIACGRARTLSGSLYLLADEAFDPLPDRIMANVVRHFLPR